MEDLMREWIYVTDWDGVPGSAVASAVFGLLAAVVIYTSLQIGWSDLWEANRTALALGCFFGSTFTMFFIACALKLGGLIKDSWVAANQPLDNDEWGDWDEYDQYAD